MLGFVHPNWQLRQASIEFSRVLLKRLGSRSIENWAWFKDVGDLLRNSASSCGVTPQRQKRCGRSRATICEPVRPQFEPSREFCRKGHKTLLSRPVRAGFMFPIPTRRDVSRLGPLHSAQGDFILALQAKSKNRKPLTAVTATPSSQQLLKRQSVRIGAEITVVN